MTDIIKQREVKGFKHALEILGITDYGKAIFSSNSRGELFHLTDYINLAKYLDDEDIKIFREIFIEIDEWAKKEWERPESVYQHIIDYL